MSTATLTDALKRLRLSGLAGSLQVRLQEAQANRLNRAEFLELILQDELAVRHDRLIARRTKAASFREQKTLEDFGWDFNRSIKKKPIFDLAAAGFVRQCRDVLLCGPPGVGKSHLAQAIGLLQSRPNAPTGFGHHRPTRPPGLDRVQRLRKPA